MTNPVPRPYRSLVAACAERDISRTVAYELIYKGLLDSFLIGRRRYVYLDSLDTLPQRLAVAQSAEVA